jgi:hypothetical protein
MTGRVEVAGRVSGRRSWPARRSWRLLPTFAGVRVAEVAAPAPPTPGLIRIELPGGVRVSVDGSVDAGALARVLSVLR